MTAELSPRSPCRRTTHRRVFGAEFERDLPSEIRAVVVDDDQFEAIRAEYWLEQLD